MNYISLLNKEDYQKYLLINYLDEQSIENVHISKLEEELMLSSYLIKKSINSLKQDIKKISLSHHFKLSVVDNYIFYKTTSRYSSYVFLTYYLQKSTKFKLLVSHFKESYITLENFAINHHMSYSSAYALLKELGKDLRKEKIFLDTDRLYGNPLNIVSFYYALFIVSNIDSEKIYDSGIISKNKNLLKIVNKFYCLTEYEKKKMFHFLCINDSLKLSNKQELTFFFDNELPDELKNYPQSYYIILWLYLNDKVDTIPCQIRLDNKIRKLNEKFLSSFKKTFAIKKLPEEIESKLMVKLSQFHFHSIYYPINKYKEFKIEISFLKQNYPEYYNFVLDYINQMSKKIDDFMDNKIYLFFNYLFLLIDTIPVSLLGKPIKVLIDFSYGKLYNRFIEKSLKIYSSIYIEILETEANHSADIILTNLNQLYLDNDAEVIVWLDPPRAKDWANLTHVLLNIKRVKYES